MLPFYSIPKNPKLPNLIFIHCPCSKLCRSSCYNRDDHRDFIEVQNVKKKNDTV